MIVTLVFCALLIFALAGADRFAGWLLSRELRKRPPRPKVREFQRAMLALRDITYRPRRRSHG